MTSRNCCLMRGALPFQQDTGGRRIPPGVISARRWMGPDEPIRSACEVMMRNTPSNACILRSLKSLIPLKAQACSVSADGASGCCDASQLSSFWLGKDLRRPDELQRFVMQMPGGTLRKVLAERPHLATVSTRVAMELRPEVRCVGTLLRRISQLGLAADPTLEIHQPGSAELGLPGSSKHLVGECRWRRTQEACVSQEDAAESPYRGCCAALRRKCASLESTIWPFCGAMGP